MWLDREERTEMQISCRSRRVTRLLENVSHLTSHEFIQSIVLDPGGHMLNAYLAAVPLTTFANVQHT